MGAVASSEPRNRREKGSGLECGGRNMGDWPELHLYEELGLKRPEDEPAEQPLPTEGCRIGTRRLVTVKGSVDAVPVRPIDTHGYGHVLFGNSCLYDPSISHPRTQMYSNVNIPGLLPELLVANPLLGLSVHEAARGAAGVARTTVTSCLLEQVVLTTPCNSPPPEPGKKVHPAVPRALSTEATDFVVVAFPLIEFVQKRSCHLYIQVATARGTEQHQLSPGEVALLPKEDVLNLRVRSSKPLLFCLIGTLTVHPTGGLLEWLPDELSRYKWYYVSGRPPVRWPSPTTVSAKVHEELVSAYHKGIANPVPFRLQTPSMPPLPLVIFNTTKPSSYNPLRIRSSLTHMYRGMFPRNGFGDVCDYISQ